MAAQDDEVAVDKIGAHGGDLHDEVDPGIAGAHYPIEHYGRYGHDERSHHYDTEAGYGESNKRGIIGIDRQELAGE